MIDLQSANSPHSQNTHSEKHWFLPYSKICRDVVFINITLMFSTIGNLQSGLVNQARVSCATHVTIPFSGSYLCVEPMHHLQ